MSTFLRTLIDRHQEVTPGRESVPKVQPRLKARFETDTGSDFFASSTHETGSEFSAARWSDADIRPDMNRNDSSAESLLTTDIRQTARQLQVATQPSNDRPPTAFDYAPRLDDMNSRIEAITLKLGRQSYGRETPVTSDSHGVNQLETTETISKAPNQRQLSAGDGINERIQEILQRLHGRQREAAGENATSLGKAYLPLMTEPLDPLAPENEINTQGMQTRSEQEKTTRSGFLQIPYWLNEMRADFYERWQLLNGKPKSEPVVNVTIGRVEVKASTPDSMKQSKLRAGKPCGVMSLDDYLKLRERRG